MYNLIKGATMKLSGPVMDLDTESAYSLVGKTVTAEVFSFTGTENAPSVGAKIDDCNVSVVSAVNGIVQFSNTPVETALWPSGLAVIKAVIDDGAGLVIASYSRAFRVSP